MYDTLIAGGGRTLSFPFVVHLQDVWRRVNGALFWKMLGLTVNTGNGISTIINTPYSLNQKTIGVVPSPEGVSSLNSLLS